MNMPIIWLVIAIAFLIGEAATFGLVSIWFAGGSAVALAASLLGAPIWIQIILFAVCSGICLNLTRDWAQKYVNERHQRTNADRVVGMEGLVVEAIDNEHAAGLVRVGGQLWTARGVRENAIEQDARVIIIAIEGVKVMVVRKRETVAPTPSSVEPVAQAAPIIPMEPMIPTVPMEPAEPMTPTVPMEPAEPMTPTVPMEPAIPMEPIAPMEPTEPMEPVEEIISGDMTGEN